MLFRSYIESFVSTENSDAARVEALNMLLIGARSEVEIDVDDWREGASVPHAYEIVGDGSI